MGTLLAGTALDLIAFPRPDPGAPPPEIAPDQAAALGWIVGPGLLGLGRRSKSLLPRASYNRLQNPEFVRRATSKICK